MSLRTALVGHAQLRASTRSRLPDKYPAAHLPTVRLHYTKRKSSLSSLSELLLFRRRRFTISTSSSTSTFTFSSSFTSSSTSTWRRRRGVGKRKRVEHNVSRRKYSTLSTSTSTSTSSFTSSSEPNGNNISSVRLSRTARTSSEKFSHDFVRAERRQYSCGIVKRRLCKRSEKSRSEADL